MKAIWLCHFLWDPGENKNPEGCRMGAEISVRAYLPLPPSLLITQQGGVLRTLLPIE